MVRSLAGGQATISRQDVSLSTVVGARPAPASREIASRARVVCHEHRRSTRRCATVREMKEGPSGSAIRSLIPSHRKLLSSKVMVVNVAETSGQ
jgi:hypothetical protein